MTYACCVTVVEALDALMASVATMLQKPTDVDAV
jgi:hypothetical protein